MVTTVIIQWLLGTRENFANNGNNANYTLVAL